MKATLVLSITVIISLTSLNSYANKLNIKDLGNINYSAALNDIESSRDHEDYESTQSQNFKTKTTRVKLNDFTQNFQPNTINSDQ
ncbi:MAG: hypothetical protein HON90_11565 [Halobacteriovoraceae bacterium]|jgi:hypothetical protein|nr:hypothetical protein [Halobacteriovoraceae bacterium]